MSGTETNTHGTESSTHGTETKEKVQVKMQKLP
jgi:hypothetical protein